MKLKIQRGQRENRGLMGGYKGMVFLLSCQLELTREEQDLVTKYKLEQHPLTTKAYQGQEVTGLTVAALLAGTSQEIDEVTTLLSNEDVIKKACRGFKTLPSSYGVIRRSRNH